MSELITLENAVRRYRETRTGRAFDAVRIDRLAVVPGEILAVTGPTGSGKSALLEMMAFLAPPDEGRVLFEGADAWSSGLAQQMRRRIPILLQKTVLFSVGLAGNVAYGLRVRGVRRAEAERRAEAALEMVGLKPLARRWHDELSFGEKRRVALARILVLESGIAVLDEPVAGLDEESRRLIRELMARLNRERGTTFVISGHEPAETAGLATRTVALRGGRLQRD